MLKRIVRGIGEAFYEAYPTIAANLGFKSAEENKAEDFRTAEGNEIIDKVMSTKADEERKDLITDLNPDEKKILVQYARLLGESEKMRIRNNLFKGILGDSKNANLISDIFQATDTTPDKRNFVQFMSNIYGRLVGDTSKNREEVDSFYLNRDKNLSDTRDAGEIFYDKLFKFLNSPRRALGLVAKPDKNITENSTAVVDLTKEIIKFNNINKKLMEQRSRQTTPFVDASSNTSVSHVNNTTTNGLAGNSNGTLLGFSFTGMNPQH